MATVSFSGLDEAFDISGNLVGLPGPWITSANSWVYAGGAAATTAVAFFSATADFEYATDVPAAGTVTSFELRIDGGGGIDLSISGLSFDFSLLAPVTGEADALHGSVVQQLEGDARSSRERLYKECWAE